MNSCAVGLGETPTKPHISENNVEENVVANLADQLVTRTKLSTQPFTNDDPQNLSDRKRDDYLSWSDYFMAVACLSAQRSKDPNTQVGACIVNDQHKIVGIGYNGMPIGCNDDDLPWGKTSSNPLHTKYPYVFHAEMNAIMNKNSAEVRNCTMYVALFPCNECAKLIIQSGIRKVVYMRDKKDKLEMKASRYLLEMAGVQLEQFHPVSSRKIVIEFDIENGCATVVK